MSGPNHNSNQLMMEPELQKVQPIVQTQTTQEERSEQSLEQLEKERWYTQQEEKANELGGELGMDGYDVAYRLYIREFQSEFKDHFTRKHPPAKVKTKAEAKWDAETKKKQAEYDKIYNNVDRQYNTQEEKMQALDKQQGKLQEKQDKKNNKSLANARKDGYALRDKNKEIIAPEDLMKTVDMAATIKRAGGLSKAKPELTYRKTTNARAFREKALAFNFSSTFMLRFEEYLDVSEDAYYDETKSPYDLETSLKELATAKEYIRGLKAIGNLTAYEQFRLEMLEEKTSLAEGKFKSIMATHGIDPETGLPIELSKRAEYAKPNRMFNSLYEKTDEKKAFALWLERKQAESNKGAAIREQFLEQHSEEELAEIDQYRSIKDHSLALVDVKDLNDFAHILALKNEYIRQNGAATPNLDRIVMAYYLRLCERAKVKSVMAGVGGGAELEQRKEKSRQYQNNEKHLGMLEEALYSLVHQKPMRKDVDEMLRTELHFNVADQSRIIELSDEKIDMMLAGREHPGAEMMREYCEELVKTQHPKAIDLACAAGLDARYASVHPQIFKLLHSTYNSQNSAQIDEFFSEYVFTFDFSHSIPEEQMDILIQHTGVSLMDIDRVLKRDAEDEAFMRLLFQRLYSESKRDYLDGVMSLLRSGKYVNTLPEVLGRLDTAGSLPNELFDRLFALATKPGLGIDTTVIDKLLLLGMNRLVKQELGDIIGYANALKTRNPQGYASFLSGYAFAMGVKNIPTEIIFMIDSEHGTPEQEIYTDALANLYTTKAMCASNAESLDSMNRYGLLSSLIDRFVQFDLDSIPDILSGNKRVSDNVFMAYSHKMKREHPDKFNEFLENVAESELHAGKLVDLIPLVDKRNRKFYRSIVEKYVENSGKSVKIENFKNAEDAGKAAQDMMWLARNQFPDAFDDR